MICAVGLLGVTIVFGKITNGAANWIYIGSFSFQPSELAKIIFIFIGASSLDVLMTKKNLLEYIIFSAVCVGLLALMGDFGTALIFFVTFLLTAFMRSGDFKTIILAVAAAIFGVTFVLKFKPYVADRFSGWRHVWEHTQDNLGYQQARVLTYMASGGLFGVGIGNGFLKQVAASESDLVFGHVYLCKGNYNPKQKHLLFNFSVLCGRTFCRSAFSQCFRCNRCPSAYRRNISVCVCRRFKYYVLLGTCCIHQSRRRENLFGKKISLVN